MEFRTTLACARTIVLVCLSLKLGAASAATVVQEIQNEFTSNAM